MLIAAAGAAVQTVMRKPDPEKAGRLVAEGKAILKSAIYSPPPPRASPPEANAARRRAIRKFTQAIAADPESADRLASKPGPLGGTSHNTFLASVLYAAASRTSDAKRGLEAFARESEGCVRKWAIAQRWEIRKSKEILSRLGANDTE